MPFRSDFDALYREHIKGVCGQLSLSVARADDIFGSEHIINEVWAALKSCEIVIAECSSVNANVYYELGIAHTLGKRTLLLSQNIEHIPFDLRHWRHLTYNEKNLTSGEFAQQLRAMIQNEMANAIPNQHDLGFERKPQS